ncbi:hypothetical protein FB639_002115 [Coemansia asiatica]|nr:hypothetical protein FB639_002115 [Coemansia asiatica]
MVKFLDECVSNLLNTYLVELIDQGRHDGSLPMIWKKSPFESKLKVFNALLEDLKALGKTSELNDDTNEITRPSKRKSGNTESKDVKRHCDDSNRDNSVNNLASFVDWVVEPGYDSNLARAGEQILMNAGVDFILPGNSTASSIATGHYAIQSSKTDLNTSSSNSIVDSYASLQLPFFDISNIF